MDSMTRRPKLQALLATGLLLATPAISLAAAEIDWGFRNSFRQYVNSGTSTAPFTASAGSTCSPNPTKGGCDPKIGTFYGVFGWTATDFDYDLPSGAGEIEGVGTVLFDRPDHFFNLSITDPIITVAEDGSAVVNARVKLVVTQGTTPPVDERMDLGEFELTNQPVVTATTVTWDLGNGAITADAATALGGFLAEGDELDPMRIILPFVDAAAPIASATILLKDDPLKADKRSLKLVVSKEPNVVPTDVDPTVDAATVRVVSSTFDHTYVLPVSNWTATIKKGVVTGYKYADSKRLLGPISSAQIIAGSIKVTGQGSALGHTLGSEPANVSVVVSSGDKSFCAGVGATSKKTFKAGKVFKGTKNTAPASCPAPPLPS